MNEKVARIWSGEDARDAINPTKLGDLLTASKMVAASNLAIIALVALFCWMLLGLVAYLLI